MYGFSFVIDGSFLVLFIFPYFVNTFFLFIFCNLFIKQLAIFSTHSTVCCPCIFRISFFDFSAVSLCIQKLLISYLCFGFFSNFYCCFTLFACCYFILFWFCLFFFVSFVVPSVCYAISAHILLSFCFFFLRFLIALHVTQFYRNIILLFKVCFFFFVFESSFYITPYCFSLFCFVFLLISFP